MGELAALAAALFWAAASISFAEIGRHISSIHLNLIKGTLAVLLMLCVLLVGSLFSLPQLGLGSLGAVTGYGWFLLILSGVIGIAIGDTAYFACLKRIGPQKGLMLESTAPLLAAVLALLLYDEYLSAFSWIGITLTTTGVLLVVKFGQTPAHYQTSYAGVCLGLAAAAAQAGGIVLSRIALDGEDIEPLTGGLVRLSAGLAFLAACRFLSGFGGRQYPKDVHLVTVFGTLKAKGLLRTLFTAVFIGTFLAIWLQQLAVKLTSAGIAQALLGCCPLIGALIGVRQGYGQPVTVWFGLLLGMAGIAVIFVL